MNTYKNPSTPVLAGNVSEGDTYLVLVRQQWVEVLVTDVAPVGRDAVRLETTRYPVQARKHERIGWTW